MCIPCVQVTLGLLLLLAVAAAPLRAENDPSDSILFLRFQMSGGQLVATGVTIVPGTVKQPRVPTPVQGELQYRVQDADRRLLFEGVIPDPTHVRYEYVDQDGNLQSTIVVSDSVEFYVRVPYRPDVARAEFSRITEVTSQGGAQAPKLVPLGSVTISLEDRIDE
jgi:hypothetical protein